MLALYLAGCLINRDLYEERRAELTDADQDGFAQAEDCDDTDPDVFPGADERCNDRDDDCDQLTDEEAVDASPWYRDADLDGFGNPADLVLACQQPQGYTRDDTDCDDLHDQVHPGADEVPYDDFDNDCQGGDLVDVDGDTHDATVAGGDDCADEDPAVYPGAVETWANGATDNDCDGDYGAATLDYGAEAWTGESEGDNAGRRLAALGDVTGDGLAEFAVGAIYQDRDYEYGGAIYIVSGGEPGPLAEEGVLRPSGAGWYLGGALDGGQDVDGDGVADLLTGSAAMDGGRGAAWLVSGGDLPREGQEKMLAEAAAWTIEGTNAGTYFGAAVAYAGDVNGDGLHDLTVAATFEDDGSLADAGCVYYWLERGEGASTQGDADWRFCGFFDGQALGNLVGPAGDQDEDGYDDVMLSGYGVIAAIVGGGSAPPEWGESLISEVVEDVDVSRADPFMIGDVDGDGRADLGVVIDNADVHFFTLLAANPSRAHTEPTAIVTYGGQTIYSFQVSDLGDLDGDGRSESMIQPQAYTSVASSSMAVVFGEQLAPSTVLHHDDLALHAMTGRDDAAYGQRIVVSDDVDGDGDRDIVVGGYADFTKGYQTGAVVLIDLPQ
ncbi:hypothetical protein L6R53_11040 [Myxococcota bacterium]|nr:hypothetical protein [Myxococcota bacterium]